MKLKREWPAGMTGLALVLVAFLVSIPRHVLPDGIPSLLVAVVTVLSTLLIAVLLAVTNLRTWVLRPRNLSLLVAAVAAGWTAARAVQLHAEALADRTPKVQLDTQATEVGEGPRKRLRLFSKLTNTSKVLVNVAYARICLYGVPSEGTAYPVQSNPNGGFVCEALEFDRAALKAEVRQFKPSEALSNPARFWCARQSPPAFCIRPFSMSTNLLPGEIVTFAHEIDRAWLEKAPPYFFLRSVVEYWPDEDGMACGIVDESVVQHNSGKGELVGRPPHLGSVRACSPDPSQTGCVRLRADAARDATDVADQAPRGATTQTCSDSSENALIRNPLARSAKSSTEAPVSDRTVTPRPATKESHRSSLHSGTTTTSAAR